MEEKNTTKDQLFYYCCILWSDTSDTKNYPGLQLKKFHLNVTVEENLVYFVHFL